MAGGMALTEDEMSRLDKLRKWSEAMDLLLKECGGKSGYMMTPYIEGDIYAEICEESLKENTLGGR